MTRLPYPSVKQLLLCNRLGAGAKAEFYLSWQPWLMQLNHRLRRAAPISNPPLPTEAEFCLRPCAQAITELRLSFGIISETSVTREIPPGVADVVGPYWEGLRMIICSVHPLLFLFKRYSCLCQRGHLKFVCVKDEVGVEEEFLYPPLWAAGLELSKKFSSHFCVFPRRRHQRTTVSPRPLSPSRAPVVISPPLVPGQVETVSSSELQQFSPRPSFHGDVLAKDSKDAIRLRGR
ncbi:unnamed protein product [Cyprideis torosa]|uniref:Uncharacterized protein n=1 Tax=Cyprideis torosa TaxID=163714 RepID=A0A7R8W0S6_9CRUS|nr:unnamed protein product [Cyprideis torosa]CAG0880060.1 unnamed protein product [Cyprideis torosa]